MTDDVKNWVLERVAEGEAKGAVATVIVLFHKDYDETVRHAADHQGALELNVGWAGPGRIEQITTITPLVLLHAFLMRARELPGMEILSTTIRHFCNRVAETLIAGLR